MFNTNLRGSLTNAIPWAYAHNIQGAIEDIQTNGLAKTTLNNGSQRCLLGALNRSNHGVRVSLMAEIIQLLPFQPGDEDLLLRIGGGGIGLEDSAVSDAIDRIATFNDDEHTTAEDVLLILKKLEENDGAVQS